MEPRLTDNYRRELDFLSEAFKEYTADHPREAARLGLPSRVADPHVARLCEGFALLTARIRAKIDDEFPEVTEALLGSLHPHYTRPWPSMGVVRVDVPPEQAATLRLGPSVPVGASLRSRPADGDEPCHFRTASPLTLWPLAASGLRAIPTLTPEESADGARSGLALSLRAVGGTRFGQIAPTFESLRFHLHGEGRTPYDLRKRLLHDLCRVEVRPTGADPAHRPIIQRPNDRRPGKSIPPVAAVGFGREESLIPFPTRSFLGYRNLQEFFAFPEKFLFIDLNGLAGLLAWPQADQAEVRFYFRTPADPESRPAPDGMQLHCVPIVNLYLKDCVPFRRDETRYEYPVLPSVRRGREIEVYSVESVTAGNETYLPYQHAATGGAGSSGTYWTTRRRPSLAEGDKRTQVSIGFQDALARPTPAPAAPQVISIQALCTDLDRPSRQPGGEIEATWSGAPAGPIRRVTPMKPAWPPPVGRDAHWRLLAHLALNHLPFGDPGGGAGVEALRLLLRLHVPPGSPAGEGPIEGIKRVESSPQPGYVRGRGVIGGVRTTIDLDPSRYDSGPHLMAEILEDFLGQYVSLNAFSELVLQLDGREVRRWSPRIGDRTLL